MKEFRVIITGCWDFTNYELLKKVCDCKLSEKVKTHKVIVVSGHEKGADALGEKYAKERKLDLEKYPADRSRGWLSSAIRNEQMARVADALIVFWDGRFHETRNMIDFANLKGIYVEEIRIEEKSTAIQKFKEEKSAMVDALKKSEEEWRKEKEQYSNLLKILDSFKEERLQQEEKPSPGRPRKNVITKAFTIDKGLNSIIGFLESTHIIKKGEMTKVIHESLWQWVAPYQKMLDEYYNESAAEDTMSKGEI